ncbi:MAG: DUF3168 domain-containing protein [Acidobacteriaceae bacterium]
MIEAGLFTLLSTNAAIAALCGTRIYPAVRPTGATYPAMTYRVIAGRARPTLNTSGMQRFRMQFDCYGATYGDAVDLRAAVGRLLNGYQGLLSDGTFLQNGIFLGPLDDFQDDARIYCCGVEFYLMFDFP